MTQMTPNIPQWCIDAAQVILQYLGASPEDTLGVAKKIAAHAPKNEDAERLDWLDRPGQEHDLVFECGDPDVGVFSAWQVWENRSGCGERPRMVAFDSSIRAAIDAARGKVS